MSSQVCILTFLLLGWGQTSMALPPLRATMPFCMGVMVGLVVGVMEPITPLGLATSTIPIFSSRRMMPRLFTPFRRYHTALALPEFLAILSS